MKVDQAFPFDQTTSVSDRFSFLYFQLCFRVSDPFNLRDLGEAQPVVHNLAELNPFIEPLSQSTPEHNLQAYEESDQAVDLYGIKHYFNRSMEPSSTTVSALLASSSFTVPQDKLTSEPLNDPENELGVAQDIITPL